MYERVYIQITILEKKRVSHDALKGDKDWG